jgi:Glu-tRNA(Gln) amidotransferase subunit E-like FAD-binding protein
LLEKKDSGQKIDLEQFKPVSHEDLEKEIKKIIKEKPGLNASAYMGLLMAKYRGKVDGKIIMEILRKFANI